MGFRPRLRPHPRPITSGARNRAANLPQGVRTLGLCSLGVAICLGPSIARTKSQPTRSLRSQLCALHDGHSHIILITEDYFARGRREEKYRVLVLVRPPLKADLHAFPALPPLRVFVLGVIHFPVNWANT